MKTSDSLCGLKNLLDNISFEENADVERANKAIMDADQGYRKFFGILRGWTSGFDEKTGYIAVFLPLRDFEKLSTEKKDSFYDILRKKFEEANFEIIYEGDSDGNVYFHVGFDSHNYILKNRLIACENSETKHSEKSDADDNNEMALLNPILPTKKYSRAERKRLKRFEQEIFKGKIELT